MTSYLNWKHPKILCLGIFWNKMILGVTPKRNLLKNLNDSGVFLTLIHCAPKRNLLKKLEQWFSFVWLYALRYILFAQNYSKKCHKVCKTMTRNLTYQFKYQKMKPYKQATFSSDLNSSPSKIMRYQGLTILLIELDIKE